MVVPYDLNVALREIVAAAVDERLGEITSREDAMVSKYGEMISFKSAAVLLNITPGTVRNMCHDGRLQGTTMGVSVRSIAQWLANKRPPKNQAVRKHKSNSKNGSRFHATP